MTVRFDSNWTYRGLQALVLENDQVRAVLLPDLGAKIWSLVYKPVDREMLWHNPRAAPRPAPFGATYDDWFSGGWDELFPNDAPEVMNGERYPDHGELWSMPFEWELVRRTDRELTLHLWRPGVVTPALMEKWVTLRAGEPLLHFRHRILNDSLFELPFLWKLHPALHITPASRIDLPARRVIIDENFRARLGSEVTEFEWPHAGTGDVSVDMRQVPAPTSGSADFYYAVELDDGWCAMTDTAQEVGFGLAFDREVLSSVWVFASYGGWRGLYTAILEPSTGYPFLLSKAMTEGRHISLAPGQTLETEVTAALYRGLSGVQRITPDGRVE